MKKIILKKESILKTTLFVLAVLVVFFLFQFYNPRSFGPGPVVVYSIEKGRGYKEIAADLESLGLIKSKWFFKIYVLAFGHFSKIQAGKYNLSPSMSVAAIVERFVNGEVIKDNIVVLEGWNLNDIAIYLEKKSIFTKNEFLQLAQKDFSEHFDFLSDKPKERNLEGYLFPDTYHISANQTGLEILKNMLANFDKKLTEELRKEIIAQNKTVYEIITMASILEKEVKSLKDKKIVAGILWKRLEHGMPLQVDATVNYITGKNVPSVSIKDTQIDSPYNTYKYPGLPLGPISNPGLDSIIAAIYPEKSPYWYYLSARRTGETIFSKTLQEHNNAIVLYLR